MAKREVHVGESDPTVDQTQLGTVLGSAAYMSPEQVLGKTVDTRSDIFSFGAVLYEMLCVRRAFDGDSNIAMMAAVLRDEPDTLHSIPELVQIVRRCLRKSPADRFQTMTEVKASIAAVKVDELAPAIAVLPFANMSDDKEQEYFSDGLAEEIINALAQIPGLKVTARTSAFAFRGKEQDITKIAEALHVSTILEGSVRKSGNRLRVTTVDAINARRAAGKGAAKAEYIKLDELGNPVFNGTTHMMMLGTNNLDVADVILKWVDTNVTKRSKAR